MNAQLDDRIKAALENKNAPAGADEASVFQLIGDVMLGRQRWFVATVVVVSLVFVAFGVFSLVRMLDTQDVRQTILWSMGLVFSMLVTSMLKIWFWMQMEKYAVVREIKRLEVQVARLAESR